MKADVRRVVAGGAVDVFHACRCADHARPRVGSVSRGAATGPGAGRGREA
jgi:hypothetical protein